MREIEKKKNNEWELGPRSCVLIFELNFTAFVYIFNFIILELISLFETFSNSLYSMTGDQCYVDFLCNCLITYDIFPLISTRTFDNVGTSQWIVLLLLCFPLGNPFFYISTFVIIHTLIILTHAPLTLQIATILHLLRPLVYQGK